MTCQRFADPSSILLLKGEHFFVSNSTQQTSTMIVIDKDHKQDFPTSSLLSAEKAHLWAALHRKAKTTRRSLNASHKISKTHFVRREK